MERLADKVALVTGSTRGVGRVVTDHLLTRGATVVGFARGPAAIEHERYHHFSLSVGDPDVVRETFGRIKAEVGNVSILVNNAAVLTSQYAMIMPASAAQDMLETNLMGTFMVSREAAKMMRRLRWGRIVTIGSMAASLAPIGDSIYAATKAAAITLSSVLAKELGPLGVTCNVLAITAFETDMLSQLPRAKIDAIVNGLPIPRYATEDDILNTLDFFLSEKSSYITAQTVWLGGIN